MNPTRQLIAVIPMWCAVAVPAMLMIGATLQGRAQKGLREALTFHAAFDGQTDATHAAGDPALYWAPSLKERQDAKPGLPAGGEIQHARGAGRFGDALRFTRRKSPIVFFRGLRNMPYERSAWDGTVSFWLRVDPAAELETGFCDPVQITPYAWNHSAFFVEFEKRADSIPFRLGVYADPDVWNPAKRKFEDIPARERPLVTIADPPFSAARWTHVVFTFERFNTKKTDGVAKLYLDGQLRGTLGSREQTFTWDPERTLIALGLGYIGLLDELSIFDRALAAGEVRQLYEMPSNVLAPTR